ncbi:MAG TPA: hypothetical protein VGO62_15915 [Myxococcota bacterium]
MAFDLKSRFETTDGSRPTATLLADVRAKALPLAAISILNGGDAFDAPASTTAARDAIAKANTWAQAKLEFESASKGTKERVRAEAARVLAGNPVLCARMSEARPLHVDVLAPGHSFVALGFPPCTNERASGLFWDHPSWAQARMAFRTEELDRDEVLVVHEVAHAVHGLAFTKAERELIYQVLRPAFVDRSSMDEAFAIYTEREYCKDFGELEKRAPGIYGFVRRQWSEDHLFTRFMRKLYFPHKPLAGPKLAASSSWKRFSGG